MKEVSTQKEEKERAFTQNEERQKEKEKGDVREQRNRELYRKSEKVGE